MTALPRRLLLLALLAAACRGAGNDAVPAQPVVEPSEPAIVASARTWDFESDGIDLAPNGFSSARTGEGRSGRWVVRAADDAPSGHNVVAQLDDDRTDGRFALLIAHDTECTDLSLAVRCRLLAGEVDQAAGLVFRLRDADSYYLVRANALEGNVRFYRVKSGHREQLASWSGQISAKEWHTLAVEARAEHVTVSWDGQRVIEATDSGLRSAGRVGLWTKSDSITEFDELRLQAPGN